MSQEPELTPSWIEVKGKVVIDRDGEVVDELESFLEYEQFCPGEHAIIELKMKVPLAVFDPVPVVIEIPDEYITPKSIDTSVDSIQSPIVLDNEREIDVTLKESVEPTQATGILAMLKRAFFKQSKDN